MKRREFITLLGGAAAAWRANAGHQRVCRALKGITEGTAGPWGRPELF
jgi:hypothetical protein